MLVIVSLWVLDVYLRLATSMNILGFVERVLGCRSKRLGAYKVTSYMQLKVAIVLTILVLLQNDHTLSMHLKGTTCFDTQDYSIL